MSRRLKLCTISNLFSPYVIGGAELFAEQLAREINKDHRAFVITTKEFSSIDDLRPSVQDEAGLRVWRFFPANLYNVYNAKKNSKLLKPFFHLVDMYNPHAYFAVCDILRRERPDVVHTHNFSGLSISVVAAAKRLGIPVVHTLHDYSLICLRAILIRLGGRLCESPNAFCRARMAFLKARLKRRVGAVIGPSRFIVDKHLEAGFFKESNMNVLPYISGHAKISRPRRYADREHLRALYIGGLTWHKGVHVFIKAVKELEGDGLRVDVAGTGPYENELRSMVGQDNRFTFHGFVQGVRKESLLRNADMMIVPSLWYDNSPVVVYEGFTHGLPLLVSDRGGLPELVTHGQNGMICPAGDYMKLAKQLRRLMTNPDYLEHLSEGSLASASLYTRDSHIAQLWQIYESVLRRKREND